MVLVMLHALPYLPRRGRLFGIAVPPEIRYGSQGVSLLRRYQLRLLPWAPATILVLLLIHAVWLPLGMTLLPLVPTFVAIRLFFQGRSEARRFALPVSPIREVQLTDAGDHLGWRALWFLPPFCILGSAALYLRANWDRIPARFPIHWDFNGHPNGWSHRSGGGVYGPLLLGALVVLFNEALALLTYRGARRGTARSTTLVVLIAVSYLIALVFSMAGLSPFWAPQPWVVFGVIVAFLVAIVAIVARAYSRPEPEGAPAESTPEQCWRGGIFYYNPDDPALFVEKRVGVGYDFNFGNRLTWVILGGILLFVAGTIFLAPKLIGGK
jgi:uncharacterized membrane protein